MCGLSYPACKVLGQYYIVMCGPSGSVFIFFTSPHKDFRKKDIKYEICVLIFTNLIGSFSHFKKNSARYYHKWGPGVA
jgi:hypothetical protein